MQCACALLYCHLWHVWLYHIILYRFINGTTFGKKLLIIKCPRRTWIKGVQAAMTTRNLEPDQRRNREEWLSISLFHRAFQFTIYNGPTNALVCNKTLIQMSQTKTLKIIPTRFDHQMFITRELFDPG
jgi:hypothetical protein